MSLPLCTGGRRGQCEHPFYCRTLLWVSSPQCPCLFVGDDQIEHFTPDCQELERFATIAAVAILRPDNASGQWPLASNIFKLSSPIHALLEIWSFDQSITACRLQKASMVGVYMRNRLNSSCRSLLVRCSFFLKGAPNHGKRYGELPKAIPCNLEVQLVHSCLRAKLGIVSFFPHSRHPKAIPEAIP